MLLSRTNELMLRAVESVERQKPDEFSVYVDQKLYRENPVTPNGRRVLQVLKHAGAKIKAQWFDGNPYPVDVVRNVHRSILESTYKWVRTNDDDDELLSDSRGILEKYAESGVGFIHGDVLAFAREKSVLRRSRQITKAGEANLLYGSGNFLNRDAFRRIHRDGLEPIPDHELFWDFKIVYWLIRAGYGGVYVPKIFSIQNVDLARMKSYSDAGRWIDIARWLNRK